MISVVVISKDEPFLERTLSEVVRQTTAREALGERSEVLVVDASSGRLDAIRRANPVVRWIDFVPRSAGVTIAAQRNTGVAAADGDIIAFTDAGAVPQRDWLEHLTRAIRRQTEQVVAGPTVSSGAEQIGVKSVRASGAAAGYVDECPTINLAFHRAVHEELGGFDESFAYGSDVDFSWRLRDAGHRIRFEPGAVVEVDWGTGLRQARRSFTYGRARARLYRKHRNRLRTVIRDDPVVVVWPLFLLGLPLAVRHPTYLLLLAIPAWRARNLGVARVLADHLLYGAGVLREVVTW